MRHLIVVMIIAFVTITASQSRAADDCDRYGNYAVELQKLLNEGYTEAVLIAQIPQNHPDRLILIDILGRTWTGVVPEEVGPILEKSCRRREKLRNNPVFNPTPSPSQ